MHKFISKCYGGAISVYYNNNIKIELCSEGTVVSDFVEIISCNIMYLSQDIMFL